MNVTRKTWVSAGIVGAILVGGMSVAAAASAGGIEKANGGTEKLGNIGEPPLIPPQEPGSRPSQNTPPSSREATPPPEDYVVSRKINPDPEKVVGYWTEENLEGAQPMPMPEGPVNATE
jgi:hypothetical protein